MKIKTSSYLETQEFGKKFAENLKGGEVVLLIGDLGAGKTTFVQGVGKFFKIKRNITSPTFVLMKIYEVKGNYLKKISPLAKKLGRDDNGGIKKLIHVDTYRGLEINDLENIGALEFFGRDDCVCFVEWGAGLEKFLKSKKIKTIILQIKNLSENEREINIK
ncbi:MAG: tRNA (adenosine(37)-N6)-threonylcarbamoyltransferase complex ATPase subunit type 1 TsaE [Patescibacteria group bacterium]